MGLIAELATLITQAYSAWETSWAPRSITPQSLFVKYIAPSYELLKQVHGDYDDLYRELQERLALDKHVSAKTVQWFSEARRRREAGRSELRFMGVPQVAVTFEAIDRALDVSAAAHLYVACVREYFEPEDAIMRQKARVRISTLDTTSASQYTEQRLRLMHSWSCFAVETQRALAVEDCIEGADPAATYLEDHLIERILNGITGQLDASETEHFIFMCKENAEALREAPEELRAKVDSRNIEYWAREISLANSVGRSYLESALIISSQNGAYPAGVSTLPNPR